MSQFISSFVRAATIAELVAQPDETQNQAGYFHTLREIRQQPETWVATADSGLGLRDTLQGHLSLAAAIVLTGSGSSQYAAECLQPALRKALGCSVEAHGGGMLLTHGAALLTPARPLLLISLARSGDSPESYGAVEFFLDHEPDIRHLVITCNRNGRLATGYAGDPRVRVFSLDDRTCDRSLVMTSSFTNLVLAGASLSGDPGYRKIVDSLATGGSVVLNEHAGAIADVARSGFHRAVYLGSGARFAAARESALKMLEMTAGRVFTMAETYLGLRHGPMCAIDGNTLVVCFLSSDPILRTYEIELIEELHSKELGAGIVIAGSSIPGTIVRDDDLAIDHPGWAQAGDDYAAILDVLTGQLLAFFACLQLGLQPDAPSVDGVISRVVGQFGLHRRGPTVS